LGIKDPLLTFSFWRSRCICRGYAKGGRRLVVRSEPPCDLDLFQLLREGVARNPILKKIISEGYNLIN